MTPTNDNHTMQYVQASSVLPSPGLISLVAVKVAVEKIDNILADANIALCTIITAPGPAIFEHCLSRLDSSLSAAFELVLDLKNDLHTTSYSSDPSTTYFIVRYIRESLLTAKLPVQLILSKNLGPAVFLICFNQLIEAFTTVLNLSNQLHAELRSMTHTDNLRPRDASPPRSDPFRRRNSTLSSESLKDSGSFGDSSSGGWSSDNSSSSSPSDLNLRNPFHDPSIEEPAAAPAARLTIHDLLLRTHEDRNARIYALFFRRPIPGPPTSPILAPFAFESVILEALHEDTLNLGHLHRLLHQIQDRRNEMRDQIVASGASVGDIRMLVTELERLTELQRELGGLERRLMGRNGGRSGDEELVWEGSHVVGEEEEGDEGEREGAGEWEWEDEEVVGVLKASPEEAEEAVAGSVMAVQA